jgi:hypothetical protein
MPLGIAVLFCASMQTAREGSAQTRDNHDFVADCFVGRQARQFRSHCSLLPRFNQPAANPIATFPNFRQEVGVAISVENETRGLPILRSHRICETDDAALCARIRYRQCLAESINPIIGRGQRLVAYDKVKRDARVYSMLRLPVCRGDSGHERHRQKQHQHRDTS